MIKLLDKDKMLSWIFTSFYIFALGLLFHIGYLYIFCEKNNLQSLAFIVASILTATALLRAYNQTKENEKLKIKRELYDRRKAVVFTLDELFEKLLKVYNLRHSHNPIEVEITFVKKCIKKLLDVKFIFDEKDYNILEPIVQQLYELERLLTSVQELEKGTVKNKEKIMRNEQQNCIHLQFELLYYLGENKKFLKESIRLT